MELRAIETAVESYKVDNAAYPRMAHYPFYRDETFDVIESQRVSGVLSRSVSTPVAYISTAFMPDVFAVSSGGPADEKYYTYQTLGAYIERNPESIFWPRARAFYGEWRCCSVGPDGQFDHGFLNSAQLVHDPTNGLHSLGNIWNAQLKQVSLPLIPELLGHH